jgi:hypothetical protein
MFIPDPNISIPDPGPDPQHWFYTQRNQPDLVAVVTSMGSSLPLKICAGCPGNYKKTSKFVLKNYLPLLISTGNFHYLFILLCNRKGFPDQVKLNQKVKI